MLTYELTKTWEVISTWKQLESLPYIIEDYKNLLLKDNEKPRIALDIETYNLYSKGEIPRALPTEHGYEARVRTVSIGFNPSYIDKQFIIDLDELNKTEGVIWDTYFKFGNILRGTLKNINCLVQNGKYEFEFFYTYFSILLEDLTDTLFINKFLKAGDNIESKLSALYKIYLQQNIFESLTGKDFDEYSLYKEINQKSDWSDSNLTVEQLQYAADDVRLIFPTFFSMCEHIKAYIKLEEGNKIKDNYGIKFILNLENKNIPVTSLKELAGVNFNKSYQESVIIPTLDEKMKEAIEAVKQWPEFNITIKHSKGRGQKKEIWFEETVINIGSSDQLSSVLEKLIGEQLPTSKNSKTGKPSCNEETLLLFESRHPCMKWVLQYRKAKSLRAKYGEGFLKYLWGDGKLHPQFHQMGTETGRFSCSDPNMQQQKGKEMLFETIEATSLFRPVFSAPDKKKLVCKDYSQIELRLIAEASGDEELIRAFKNNEDLHSLTAKKAFKLDFLPGDDDPRRHIGKTLNFTVFYKASPNTVMNFIKEETGQQWTIDEAKNVIKAMKEGYPKVAKMMKESDESVWKLPVQYKNISRFGGNPFYKSKTFFGRQRRFGLTAEQIRLSKDYPEIFQINTDEWTEGKRRVGEVSREAYNARIQGTGADILKLALLSIYKEYRDNGWIPEGKYPPVKPPEVCIILSCHDEIVSECPETLSEQVNQIMTKCMIEAEEKALKKIPSKVSGSIGNSWFDAK